MSVKFISVTENAEQLISYCARVSSPQQDNPQISGLLKYMIREAHWSPFEMADMVVEITTSRAIAQQILRHRSFNFQEFSQRYAETTDYILYAGRRQDEKNRQNSIDDIPQQDQDWFIQAQVSNAHSAFSLYKEALERGFAKESARFLLPLATETKLYMKNNLRGWIHYIQLRTGPETQLEHREIALECKEIFIEQFPIISEALEWTDTT